MSVSGKRRLPGDLSRAQELARMLRVDHAGEYGATRIYEGQLTVLGHRPVGRTIRQMAAQEGKNGILVERYCKFHLMLDPLKWPPTPAEHPKVERAGPGRAGRALVRPRSKAHRPCLRRG